MAAFRHSRVFALLFALLLAAPMAPSGVAQTIPQPVASAVPAIAIAEATANPETMRLKASDDPLVSVIVKLADAPLAAYRGGLPGLPATSPSATGAERLETLAASSQRYLAYLDRQMATFEAATLAALPQAQLTARYTHVFGGAALIVRESQVAQVAALPGVQAVLPDTWRETAGSRGAEFIGAEALWQALVADPTLGDAGEGVIVGVIDTGIWPEHPSFADNGSYPAPPSRWTGACEQPRDTSPAIVCNNKLIGARVFLDTYRTLRGIGAGDYDAVRDSSGHGTHTASTAAGNAGVPASIFGHALGTISGVAPRAHIAAYKGLGTGGGYTSDLVQAIDQAVADGVDVINYSIGSLSDPSPYTQPDSQAFLDAYRAGVFVAVAAGNTGPNANSIGSPANAPWVTSVAASTTDQRFGAELRLQAGAEQLVVSGVSVTGSVSSTHVINAAALGDRRCERNLPATVSDTIVLCERGGNARVDKSENVRAGGGAGMVLYNPTLQDLATDNHWVPTIHINGPEGTQVVSFTNAFSPTVMGEIVVQEPSLDPQAGDVVAAFSSRGPLDAAQLGISKPDIAAPGVQILAGHTPAPAGTDGGPPGELFQAISGTSMAAPHVAGSAALLKALHPDWSPGQIKSALMTSAHAALRTVDGAPATPYDVGSGRVDLTRAGDPGLTMDIPAEDYTSGVNRLSSLNYPSISIPSMPGKISVTRTVHSELAEASVWTASVEATAGVTISVNPAQLSVPAYGDASFVVTIDAGSAPNGTYFGRVLLQSGARTVQLPVSFTRAEPIVGLDYTCAPPTIALREQSACAISVANNSSDAASIGVRSTLPAGLPVDPASVQGGRYLSATNTVEMTSRMAGVEPARVDIVSDTAIISGYLPLANLGVPPSSCSQNCDDDAVTYLTPSFSYAGSSYDRVTMVTNGYLIVGGDRTILVANQRFPNVSRPNNVIAPLWTDLDLDGPSATDNGHGTWYAAYVTFAGDPTRWFVGEWTDASRYGLTPEASHHTFQIWIEEGSGRIVMVYGPDSGPEDLMTVGAENADGTAGTNVYVDTSRDNRAGGDGTPPAEGDQYGISGTPALLSTQTLSFTITGAASGVYTPTAELRSSLFAGTSVTTTTVTVGP